MASMAINSNNTWVRGLYLAPWLVAQLYEVLPRASCNVRKHARRHSARDPVNAVVIDGLRLLRCGGGSARAYRSTNCKRDQCDAERVNISQPNEKNDASASAATAHSTVSSLTRMNT